MDYAFEYVESHPLMTEESYPYTGKHTSYTKCKYHKADGVGHVVGYTDVPPKEAS